MSGAAARTLSGRTPLPAWPCERITRSMSEDDAPASDLRPCAGPLGAGDRLPGTPYVIVRLLGQGGMGEVYEVEHRELGRRSAVKVLRRDHHDRPDLAGRMRAEARSLARLRHENLVEVFDLGVTSDGRPYFAMPLLRGRDLRSELARLGVLAPRAAAELVAQALDGLAAAHAAGLVHRDVKLENLFLGDDGRVKVLDFGVAKAFSGGLTLPGGSPGTPRTMAPEQCSGRPVDARADVYAAGLALYELCAGRGPFDELQGNVHALRFAHCEREPPPPSHLGPQPIDRAVEAVILRALAKDPADRYPGAAAMAAALRRAIAPSAPRVEPPGRAWTPVALSAAAIALFALGTAFGRVLPDRPAPPIPPAPAALSAR